VLIVGDLVLHAPSWSVTVALLAGVPLSLAAGLALYYAWTD
jgi:hypothetical protein